MQTVASRPAIKPRNPDLVFDETIPKHWFADSMLASHMVNGVNLLFPAGERFFVRSVHHYLDKLEDPELKKQVRGFFGQEGRHARAHEDFFACMEAQGYEIREFLRLYEKIGYEYIEPNAPAAFRLATTAALEHYTAALAHSALRYKLLDKAHPALRDLLNWHASEEIEHRAVAFDVLNKVAPGYGLRMAGFAMATLLLGAFWAAAMITLIRQDTRGQSTNFSADFAKFKTIGVRPRRLFRMVKAYLRPDFHPLQMDDMDELAREWLAQKGMA
ncbi:MAG: metal-dependent hydrolase [Polyangiaceae bacterium]|nr:metal-dependent hydrolase [Polyangiaceae bacterium]